jgi:hypothetical protein
MSLPHKVTVKFDMEKQVRLQETLDYCRNTFGHRGKQSGWWWRPKRHFRDGIFIFSFRTVEDALAFKIARG